MGKIDKKIDETPKHEIFHFFIEYEKSTNNEKNQREHTPFNLLPKNWVGLDYALKLVAILPVSSKDFTRGWTKANYMPNTRPSINFYSSDEVDRMKNNEDLKSINKIFISNNDFSIPLITNVSTKSSPSIILSHSKGFLEKFDNDEIFIKINISDLEVKDIEKRLFQKILNLFINQDKSDFQGNKITDSYTNNYQKSKDFLSKPTLSLNLLTNPNEIIVSGIRGKLPKHINSQDNTQECYRQNVKLAKEIIIEKSTDFLLGLAQNNWEIVQELPQNITDHINKIIEKDLKKQEKRSEYESIKSNIKENKFKSSPDFKKPWELAFLFPTINPKNKEALTAKLNSQYSEISEDKIKKIIRSVLRGGRGIEISVPKKNEDQIKKIFGKIGKTRLYENRFLTDLTTLYANRNSTPVLKTEFAPSNLFIEFQSLREHISGLNIRRNNENNSDASEWKYGGQRFEEFISKLNENMPSNYFKLIGDLEPSRITIFSDLPFELISYNNMALCQAFPTTRYPITPLGLMTKIYNNLSSSPIMEIEMESFKGILLINSLTKEDKLYPEFEVFKQTCEERGLDFNFVSVKSSEEFIEAINTNPHHTLGYFGHATYDVSSDEGKLKFKKDSLSYNSLKRIKKPPKLALLIGCETASCSALTGGLANHFLGIGTKAVLGTLYPIPPKHAVPFIGRAFKFLDGNSATFSRLVYESRKLGHLLDTLQGLVDLNYISYQKMPIIMKDISEEIMHKEFREEREIQVNEAEKIIQEHLEKYDLKDGWEEQKKVIIPYSLFFTLLGDAHNLILKS